MSVLVAGSDISLGKLELGPPETTLFSYVPFHAVVTNNED